MANKSEWERLHWIGGGGQSEVYLVRSPKRSAELRGSLKAIQQRPSQTVSAEEQLEQVKDFARAIRTYVGSDQASDLGALKQFKIPPEVESPSLAQGSKDYEAVQRLQNEIKVLSERRSGLPRLLDSNLAERWIITEYFSEKTLLDHPLKYRGRSAAALTAFRSLVQTVAELHKVPYIHRDIKPANVFIRSDCELVLGDFGIVYVPDAPARVTLSGEKVGPRDYMPQWGNLGERLENVSPSFDVYMLGKLLWSMLDGRPVLQREYYNNALTNFDLTRTFPDDPDMHLINAILSKCVVEYENQCLRSANELLPFVDEALAIVQRRGQLLSEGVPRPCHVCGKGFYQPGPSAEGDPNPVIRIALQQPRQQNSYDILCVLTAWPFFCSKCGHVQFFKAGPFSSV